MELLKTKFGSLKQPAHFFVYCLNFMLYALFMTGIGPYIPYLAQQTKHKQTQYSYLLFCRSAGFFVGSLLLKALQKTVPYHTIMMWSSVFIFVFMLLFTYVLDFMIQGIFMFIIAVFISIINILVNVCVAETQKGGNVNFWMHILHGSYGIGGLISPLIIYTFQLNSYLIIGILLFIMAPCYYKLKSPEKNHKNYSQIISTPIYEIQTYEQPTKNSVKRRYISHDSEYLLCFMFWIYIGVQLGFANWISSYAVLQNVATKQESVTYNSMFWISMTIFRFISSFLPFKSMRKLMIHESLLMGFTAICLIMIFSDQIGTACIMSSITFGMCFSAMYPLFLSLPMDYNLEISSTQMANIGLWSALGEATLALCFGLFMEWMGANMLFYITFIMTIMLIFMTQYLEELYIKESKKGEQLKKSEIMDFRERLKFSSQHLEQKFI